jgi:hypothetical protein
MSGVPNTADMSGTYDTSGVNPGMNDQLAHMHNEIFETNPKTQAEILAEEAALQIRVEAARQERLKNEALEAAARIPFLKDAPFVTGAQYRVDVEELKKRIEEQPAQEIPYAPTFDPKAAAPVESPAVTEVAPEAPAEETEAPAEAVAEAVEEAPAAEVVAEKSVKKTTRKRKTATVAAEETQ